MRHVASFHSPVSRRIMSACCCGGHNFWLILSYGLPQRSCSEACKRLRGKHQKSAQNTRGATPLELWGSKKICTNILRLACARRIHGSPCPLEVKWTRAILSTNAPLLADAPLPALTPVVMMRRGIRSVGSRNAMGRRMTSDLSLGSSSRYWKSPKCLPRNGKRRQAICVVKKVAEPDLIHLLRYRHWPWASCARPQATCVSPTVHMAPRQAGLAP